MPVIFIGGYYGGNNLGDDAILEAILQSLRKLRDDLQFSVASFNPDVTRAKFAVESVHWRQMHDLANCVQHADLVLVGGGGLFQDYWGIEPDTYLRSVHGGITTYGTLPKLAELFGVPCMLYAVGVGPLFSEEARSHTRDIFSLCAAFTVRDENSSRLLHEIGWEGNPDTVEVTADPVFSLKASEDDEQAAAAMTNGFEWKSSGPLIAVSLRYWERDFLFSQWTSSLAAGLDEFIQSTDARLIFTPFQVDPESQFTDDMAVNRVVVEKMTNSRNVHLVESILRPGEIQALYGQCEMVIAMRLHASILAINAGTPAFAIVYDPKVASLMGEFELQKYTAPLNALDQLGHELEAAWQERETIKKAILRHRPDLQARAGRNAQIALSLLESHLSRLQKAEGGKALAFALERIRQMERMDTELSAIKQKLASSEKLVDTLTADKARLEARLQEMENSRGWKMLEKIRGLRRRILRLVRK